MRFAPPEFLSSRHARLAEMLAAHQLDALVVTSLANLAYLTNFFGSAGLAVVRPGGLRLITDTRYGRTVHDLADQCETIAPVVVPSSLSYDEALAGELRAFPGARVGFEESHLTVRRHRIWHASGSNGPFPTLVPTDGLVEDLRVVKDAWEVGVLREAAARLSSVAKCILPRVLAGLAEREVAADIDAELGRAGFQRPAFDTIVASGPNAAEPHYRAGARRIERGELVVVDFGGVLDGYCVDLTRTVTVGGGDARTLGLLECLGRAQQAAFEAVAPGVAPETVDQAARSLLEKSGFGEAFLHGTGHGLGLELHERPRIGPAREGRQEGLLAPAMVFTLEPGAYFSGWGGARIEDDVLVTAAGCERLTDVPHVL
jgi:Xaa-Pro aminopeptidase